MLTRTHHDFHGVKTTVLPLPVVVLWILSGITALAAHAFMRFLNSARRTARLSYIAPPSTIIREQTQHYRSLGRPLTTAVVASMGIETVADADCPRVTVTVTVSVAQAASVEDGVSTVVVARLAARSVELAAAEVIATSVVDEAWAPFALALAFAVTLAFAPPAFGCCTTTQLPNPPAVLNETRQRSLFLPPWHVVPPGSLTEIAAEVTVGGF